jgi:hypothetical protein
MGDAQGVQLVMPARLLLLTCPGGHGEHAEPSQYFPPVVHSVQAEERAVENSPWLHGVQEPAPSFEYVFAPHVEHATVEEEYSPAGQLVQLAKLYELGLTLPAGQSKHCLSDTRLPDVPQLLLAEAYLPVPQLVHHVQEPRLLEPLYLPSWHAEHILLFTLFCAVPQSL